MCNMELEACDDIFGASEDDCINNGIVTDSISDASVLVGESEGIEDIPGQIEIVACTTPSGESEEEVKAKKKQWKCRVCKRKFGSGQGLGGHMNAHPKERIKKAMQALMKIHDVKDSWAQDRTLDRQRLSWFQAPPNAFNLVSGPANNTPNSYIDSTCDPVPQTIFQHPVQYQAWSQSNFMMPPNSHNSTVPSWNTPGLTSEADFSHSVVPCTGPCCNPTPQVNFQQAAQDQEYSLMAPNMQDLTTSIWNNPLSSQPFPG